MRLPLSSPFSDSPARLKRNTRRKTAKKRANLPQKHNFEAYSKILSCVVPPCILAPEISLSILALQVNVGVITPPVSERIAPLLLCLLPTNGP